MKVGIGYMFGAKDDGLKSSLKSLKTGLSDISGESGKATASGGRLRDAMLGLQTIQLSRLTSEIESIGSTLASAAGGRGPSDLESRFAQERTALDQTMRAAGAAAGILGSDLDRLEGQAFGMSKGLNRSAEDIGKSLIEIQRRGLTPKDFGLDTMDDLFKATEVAGIGADKLATHVKNLQVSYGATTDETGKFLDRFTAMASEAGIAGKALSGLPGVLAGIDKEYAKTAGVETMADVEKAGLSILKLGAAFDKLSVEDPMEKAQALFHTLFTEGEASTRMMAGLQSEFGPMAQEMALANGTSFGQILKDLEDMKDDPAAFAMKLQEITKELDATGNPIHAKRFKDMLGSMDADLAFLAESNLDLKSIFGDMQVAGDKSAGALQRMGREGFRTGRTLEDRMELARDTLDDTFKSLGRPAVVKMVDRQTAAYGRLGDVLKLVGMKVDDESRPAFDALAEKLGISGEKAGWLNEKFGWILRSISAFSAGGILAVLFGGEQEMSVTHAILAEVFDLTVDGLTYIAPLVGAVAFGVTTLGGAIGFLSPVLGSLVSALSFVAGIFGSAGMMLLSNLPAILVAATGGIFLFTKALDGSLGPAAQGVAIKIESMLSGIMDWGSGILGSITSFFDGLDAAAIVDSIAGFFGRAIGMVGGALPQSEVDGAATGATDRLLEAFYSALGAAGGFASRLSTEVWSRVMEAFGGTDAKSTFLGIGKAIQDQFMGLASMVPGWVSALQDVVGGALKSGIGLAIGFVKDMDYAALYDGIVSGLERALSNVGEIRATLAQRFRDAIDGTDWNAVFRGIFEKGLEIRNDVLGLVGQYYDTLTEKIMAVDWAGLGKRIGKAITTFLVGGAEEDAKTGASLASVFLAYFVEAVRPLGTKDFWVPVGETLLKGGKFLLAQSGAMALFFAGLFEGIGEALLEAIFGKDTGQEVMKGLKTIASWFAKLQVAGTALFGALLVLTNPVVQAFTFMVAQGVALYTAFQTIKAFGEAAFAAIATGFANAKTLASSVIGMFIGGAGGEASLLGAFDTVKSAFSTFGEFVSGLWDGLVESAEEVLDGLPDVFEDTFQGIAATIMSVWDGVLAFFASAWEQVTGGLEGVSAVLGVLSDTFGFTAPTAPTTPIEATPEEIQETQRASTGKLLAQADIRSLMQHLTNEFSAQNEILKEIARKTGTAQGAAPGGGGGQPAPETATPGGI